MYRKPIVLIAGINIVLIALIAAALPDSMGGDPRQVSPVQLKARAARLFEAERRQRTMDYGYLVALSSALKFQQYTRVEELLKQYDSKRTL